MLRAVVMSLLFFGLSVTFQSGLQAQPLDIEQSFKNGEAEWNRGDPVSAMPLLKTAADAGHPGAQALFGYLMDQADNDSEAAEYYRRAADQGNADGAFGLAGLYISGDGGVGQDYAKALQLLKVGATAGHSQSIITLSQAYANGGIGLGEQDKSSAEALVWTRRAADQDHLPSLVRLESAYRTGGYGLSINVEMAKELQAKIFKIQGIDPNAAVKKKRVRKL